MEFVKIILMGFSHLIVSFTSISVVSTILGFNLPIAFLFAGIGTLIFHAVTKNRLPIVLGVSGLYVGGILSVTQSYGTEYAMGGIIVAGFIYIIFAFIMHKWQYRILEYFPNWLLSATVLLIGLNLLPIGKQLMSTNLLVGLISFTVVAVINMSKNKKLAMFAMPLGVLAGTVTMLVTKGIDISQASQITSIQFMLPKFAWTPILTIAPLAIAVAFETLGDTKNNSDIIGINIFEDVGLSRIFLGNGLATIVGGLFGANAYTTYSENNAFVMLSQYYNPKAQLVTAILMIFIAFMTPVFKVISLIPVEALGGVVTYLFAMIAINAIRQICVDKEGLKTSNKAFTITIIMLGVASVDFVIGGVGVSSVAIATVVGTLLNILYPKDLTK